MIDAMPFDMPNNLPFVIMEGRIGAAGLPARVLLDTGAGAPFDVMISPSLAERAGAVLESGEALAARGAIGDEAVAIRPARIAGFALGPVRLATVSAGISPLLDSVSRQLGAPVDAIVGHRFIAGRTIAIDYVRRLVELDARAGRAESAIAFAIAPRRPLTLVRATINGRGPFLMALDTGASTTLLSPALAQGVGVRAEMPAQLGGAGGTTAGGARLGRATIRLGTIVRDGQNVAVADVLGPIRAVAGARIEGVLGADFFRTGRIIIDYGGQRLWFEEGQAGG
ncbi:MAG TPA: aspartyl protease family protein [Allosphingosinicella sp.]|nr:aspartyl protease family protein [Allosphingosinicella sp.]